MYFLYIKNGDIPASYVRLPEGINFHVYFQYLNKDLTMFSKKHIFSTCSEKTHTFPHHFQIESPHHVQQQKTPPHHYPPQPRIPSLTFRR